MCVSALVPSDDLHDGQPPIVVPDLVEAIIGWRSWDVRPDELSGQMVLCSPVMDSEWRGGSLAWNGVCDCGVKDHAPKVSMSEIEAVQRQLDAGIDEGLIQIPSSMSPMLHGLRTVPQMIETALRRHADYEHRSHYCQCGINAFSDYATLRSRDYAGVDRSHRAVGQVALEGAVRTYERGYRAQRARIIRVWAIDIWAAEDAPTPLVELACQAAGIEYMGILDVEDLQQARALKPPQPRS